MTVGPSTGSWLVAVMLVVAAFLSCSCSAPLMKLPAGPGIFAPDTADALAQATAVCRAVRTITADVTVRGSAGGRRVGGRLAVGLAAPASVRLEAPAPFGQPFFILAATQGDATVLLRDGRVLEHGRPDEVLEAVAGVPLGVSDWRATLTGCASDMTDAVQGRQLGAEWRLVRIQPEGEMFLHRARARAPWQLVAVVHPSAGSRAGWRSEYHDFQNGLPRTVRVTSVKSNGPGSAGFDLRLALAQVDINQPLEAGAFRVTIPPSATPMTIEELRQAGPFRRAPSDDR